MHNAQALTQLPDSLIQAASNCRDLVVESGSILYEAEQGFAPFATITVNHWIAVRDGRLVMEVGMAQRERADKAEGWSGAEGYAVSEPLTEAQALQIIAYWRKVSAAAAKQVQAMHQQEFEARDAFGPRSAYPWEV